MVIDPVSSAKAAGLRYVSDARPGIRRRRQGEGFRYVDAAGGPLHDRAERRRIQALAIPPAWQDVWICPVANGHLQATGRDARGRKQYRYHADWRTVRDETKFGRMVAFGEALPRLRARLERDLGLPGLPRDKVLALVVKLLETTLIRVGNEEYARENRSFGLTTMRSRHVEVSGSTVRFQFRGKSGKEHSVAISNRRVARVVRACRELPGHELFQYVDEAGERQGVDSADVNGYLREATGEEFTAKDFRTWGGTVLALAALLTMCGDPAEAADNAAGGPRDARHAVNEAIARVAAQLGNRPAICRKYYVHPGVIAAFLEGRLHGKPVASAVAAATEGAAGAILPQLEAQTLALLEGLPAPESPARRSRGARPARRRTTAARARGRHGRRGRQGSATGPRGR